MCRIDLRHQRESRREGTLINQCLLHFKLLLFLVQLVALIGVESVVALAIAKLHSLSRGLHLDRVIAAVGRIDFWPERQLVERIAVGHGSLEFALNIVAVVESASAGRVSEHRHRALWISDLGAVKGELSAIP